MNENISSSPFMGALSHFTHEIYKMEPLLPMYIHLVVSAVFPIFVAAHASLRRPSSAAPNSVKKKETSSDQLTDSSDVEDTEEESSSPIETLTTSDAILFPVLAGITLTGLYLIIKWLEDPALLNKVLGYYFSWIGTFFTFKFIRDSLVSARSWILPSQFSSNGCLYRYNPTSQRFDVNLSDGTTEKDVSTIGLFGTKWLQSYTWPVNFLSKVRRFVYYRVNCITTIRKPLSPGQVKFALSAIDMLAAATSVVLSLLSTGFSPFEKTPWYLTNLQGFSFCYGSLQFMTPGTASVGTLLLSLLFFYDIYMVFYTPMMVTVATKLDVPIKLLFPRPADGSCPRPIGALPGSEEMEQFAKCLAKQRTMAMLGLGDIVIPGIMIAYALRFDLYRYYLRLNKKHNSGEQVTGEDENKKQDTRPIYLPARSMWAERFYTARKLWSPALEAKSFPKPYFRASMVGYVLGMVTTLVVMQVYQHAQPALLYLVPGVLTSFWGMALWKGEVKMLWKYDEAEEEKEAEKKKDKEKKDTQADTKTAEDKQAEATEDSKDNTSQKEVEKADESSQPVVSLNIYLPASLQTSTSGKARSASTKTADDNAKNQENAIENSSKRSSPMTSSSSSLPELISKEEAVEGLYQFTAGKSDKKTDPVVDAVNDEDDTVDAAKIVKRRRKD